MEKDYVIVLTGVSEDKVRAMYLSNQQLGTIQSLAEKHKPYHHT